MSVFVTRIKHLLCFALFYTLSGISFAEVDNFEKLQDLQNIAKDFAMKNVSLLPGETADVQVSPLDSNLKLAACTTKIDASLPVDANRQRITAVTLACNGAQQWHTYIPVNVQILTNVLVANKPIQAKDLISEADIDSVPRDKNNLMTGYFQDKDLVVGQEATQLISAGSVFTKRNVRSPLLVHKNQMVDIIAKSGSIVVTVKGVAKMDGRMNDPIKVVNPSTSRTLDAVVIGADKAQVLG